MADKPKRGPVHFPGVKAPLAEQYYQSEEGKKAYKVEPPEGGWDSSYVPGFSDQKHMNEMLKLQGEKPLGLPANLCWLPINKKALMLWTKKGYEVITDGNPETQTSEMLAKHGWKVPEQATVMPNGTIQREDVVLGYVPGERYLEEQEKEAEERAFREGATLETEEKRKVQLTDDDIMMK